MIKKYEINDQPKNVLCYVINNKRKKELEKNIICPWQDSSRILSFITTRFTLTYYAELLLNW